MHLVRPALRPGVEAALKSLGLLPAAEDDREALCGALVELVTSRLKAGDEFSASQWPAAPAAQQAAAAARYYPFWWQRQDGWAGGVSHPPPQTVGCSCKVKIKMKPKSNALSTAPHPHLTTRMMGFEPTSFG